MASTHRPLLAALFGLAAVVAASGAQAQAVYRIVGPDGRVTFSDRPPPDRASKPGGAAAGTGGAAGAAGAAGATAGSAAGANDGAAALPFDLRQIVNRFPVTLYTSKDCAPCGAGRSMLSGRGIPFTERTISGDEDVQALQRLAGAASVPLLTIGTQQLRGYSQGEWKEYLDAAGYPAASQLPASYRQTAATPLVAVQLPATPARPQAPDPAPTPVAAPAAAPTPPAVNPAGIRF